MVSTTQPRMILRVLQPASPLSNFLTELGSFRSAMSEGCNGRRTASIHEKRVRRAAERRRGGSWVAKRKSSIKTSTVFNGGWRGPRLAMVGGGKGWIVVVVGGWGMWGETVAA